MAMGYQSKILDHLGPNSTERTLHVFLNTLQIGLGNIYTEISQTYFPTLPK